jgi:plastocyanin
MTHTRVRFVGSLVALGLMAACGGSSPNSPSGVTVIVRDGGAGGVNGVTVTITAAGVTLRNANVPVGQTVTFINNDSRSHQIASDPHPQHGSCPSIEAGLGTIGAGQTKVTHMFANTGTCGYHDHLDDSNPNLKGTITVQ